MGINLRIGIIGTTFSISFGTLNDDGTLKPIDFDGNDDSGAHTFNQFQSLQCGLSVRLEICTGSDMFLVWKNEIFKSDEEYLSSISQNFGQLFDGGQTIAYPLGCVLFGLFVSLSQKKSSWAESFPSILAKKNRHYRYWPFQIIVTGLTTFLHPNWKVFVDYLSRRKGRKIVIGCPQHKDGTYTHIKPNIDALKTWILNQWPNMVVDYADEAVFVCFGKRHHHQKRRPKMKRKGQIFGKIKSSAVVILQKYLGHI